MSAANVILAWSAFAAGLRHLLRHPWSSALTVAMLAVGIAVSTAVFSIMAPMLLKPLGLNHGDRLIEAFRTTQGRMGEVTFTFKTGMTETEINAQQGAAGPFSAMTMASRDRFEVRAPGQEARFLKGAYVSGGYYEVLGVQPALGRRLTAGDGQATALISHALWQSQFAGNPQVVGQVIWINRQPATILGVFPKGFAGHVLGERMDLWVAESTRRLLDPTAATRMEKGFSSTTPTLARLKPGATLAQAQATLLVTGSSFQPEARPDITVSPLSVRPAFQDRHKALEDRLPAPWLLLSVAGILLLLACANVTNLQLAQLEARRQEFAARLALGARGGVILRQLLGENLILCSCAGLLGLALAAPILGVLAHIKDVQVYDTRLPVELSGAAILFASVIAGLCGLATSLLPALRASRQDLIQVIKGGGGQARAHSSRIRDGLVVLQVGLALALVTGGTLITRSLDLARSTDLGFKTAGVAALRVEFAGPSRDQGNEATLNRLQERLRALPGIRACAVANALPMETGSTTISNVGNIHVRVLFVGPDYFRTLGIPLLKGREFLEQDLRPDAKVALVNQALAQKLFAGTDPVGRLTKQDGKTILGLVADHATVPEKSSHEPVLFLPNSARVDRAACLLFQMDGQPEVLFPMIRQLVRELDPDLPILQLGTLTDHLGGLYHDLQVASWLLSFCGIVSLCLSGMGVQSLLAFRVARQTREIGIRMALGAARGAILRRVVLRGMASVLVGLALGSLGAYGLGKALHGTFPGLAALQPGSLLVGLLVLFTASFLACLGPALSAASVDPATTMRQE